MDNWSKIEFIFAHKLNVDPIRLRELEFYTIENILKEYEHFVEEENKQYEKQQRDAERQQKMQSSSFGSGFKPPAISPPNFSMPKF